jgi:hypothetical protein
MSRRAGLISIGRFRSRPIDDEDQRVDEAVVNH